MDRKCTDFAESKALFNGQLVNFERPDFLPDLPDFLSALLHFCVWRLENLDFRLMEENFLNKPFFFLFLVFSGFVSSPASLSMERKAFSGMMLSNFSRSQSFD